MNKLLTVAVPCYNVGWCLEKCLSSFLAKPLPETLEIIIVNDGSTDDTVQIASAYIEKYPDLFTLIDKPNGGHGSAINSAIKQASGKYFTAVDADDRIFTKNLNAFLDALANSEADAVITHYRTEDMHSGKRRSYKTGGIPLGTTYTLEDFTAFPGEIYTCAVYHGLTYRTRIYQESGTALSEGIYYVDHEYATLPFVSVRTVLPLDMFFYEYHIGNPNQSVSDANQVRLLSHTEQVVRKIFRCYHENSGISIGARRYIARNATEILLSFYIISMIKNPDKSQGRRASARLRREMRALGPEMVSATDGRYKMAFVMSLLGFKSGTLEWFKRTPLYTLYRKAFKRNRRGIAVS